VTTFEVRVSIDNPQGKLKAGMTANAEIILDEHKNAIIVPEGAIIYDKDKNASIELVDPKGKDGKRKVPVKVGISNGAKTEIVSNNLKKDEEVVLQ
jgi:HlyD family secretion protein